MLYTFNFQLSVRVLFSFLTEHTFWRATTNNNQSHRRSPYQNMQFIIYYKKSTNLKYFLYYHNLIIQRCICMVYIKRCITQSTIYSSRALFI